MTVAESSGVVPTFSSSTHDKMSGPEPRPMRDHGALGRMEEGEVVKLRHWELRWNIGQLRTCWTVTSVLRCVDSCAGQLPAIVQTQRADNYTLDTTEIATSIIM